MAYVRRIVIGIVFQLFIFKLLFIVLPPLWNIEKQQKLIYLAQSSLELVQWQLVCIGLTSDIAFDVVHLMPYIFMYAKPNYALTFHWQERYFNFLTKTDQLR